MRFLGQAMLPAPAGTFNATLLRLAQPAEAGAEARELPPGTMVTTGVQTDFRYSPWCRFARFHSLSLGTTRSPGGLSSAWVR
jgi:hypothetical protein